SLCIGLLLIAQTKAQTADEIVNKYFDAIGGKAKLETVKTSYSEGEMSIMNNPAPFISSVIDGKASKSEMNFNGQKIINCYTAGAGWTVNPLAGITEPTPMPAEQVGMGPMTYDLKGPMYNYAAKGYKLELAGKEKLKNADVFKLTLNTKDSTEIDCYIDAASWLLLQTVIKVTVSGQPVEISIANSDYQKTNIGLLMPFVSEVTYPGLTIVSTTKIMDLNRNIDPAIFVMPKK
ncbi:MAG TPA: hypothetical protein VK622_17465, partial [Puia sp.]|nr:hypothetical protein [Puia sp.]